MDFIDKPLLVSANPETVEELPCGYVQGSTTTTKSLVIRATDDYAAWVLAFAEFRRATYARLIDEALADYAEKTGFKKPPVRT